MPPEEVLGEVRAWIKKAKSDFRNIEIVLAADDPPLDTVCFHAQQAAEKYIKALLTFLGVPFGKTHDLGELVLCLPSECAVIDEVGDLSDLSDAAVAVRYPGDPWEYGRDVAEQLVEKAKEVRSSVLKELGRRGYRAE